MTTDVVEPTAPQTEEQIQAGSAAAAQAYRDKFTAGTDDGTPAVAPVIETAAEDAPVRPEGVPEKFWNAETGVVNYADWGKSHSGLEAKFHADKTPNGDGDNADDAANASTEGDSTETAAVLETPAAQTAAANYAENGKLEDADYTALEAQGITRDMADAYIAGKESKAAVINNAAYEPAGGQEQYDAMIVWASTNLDAPSKVAFNSQLATGDPDVIRAAVTALATEYSKEQTVEGNRVGGGAGSSNSSTFASRAEMTKAINAVDEATGRRKYDTDPAYRNEVMRKIGASRKANTVNF